ncbi:MAG: phosphodiester glycosidase family protein [Hyphomonadaceae bacterium]
MASCIRRSVRTASSRYLRNGVGVTGERTAVFVISDDEVSFGKLARFFRDVLKADNALYFDGAVSSLWAPSINRMDSSRDLGPMVVVTSP